MAVVLKQMAAELAPGAGARPLSLSQSFPHTELKSPRGALIASQRPSAAVSGGGHSEVLLLRRQLAEERVARRTAAREARQREGQLRLRVEELEEMLGEAPAAVTQAIDASMSQSTTGASGW